MGDWKQLALTVLGSGAVFSFLTVVFTLYFTRGKTAAETGKYTAEAHKLDSDATRTEAESVQMYVSELRSSIQQWKTTTAEWADCMRDKSAAESRLREETTERERLEKYAEGLRLQKVAADVEITRLNGELAEERRKHVV